MAKKARLLKREALGPSLPPRENLHGKGIIYFPPSLLKCWQPTGWSREMGAHGVKSSPGSTKTDCKTPFGSSEAIFPPPSPVLPSQKGEGHAGEFQSEPCKECRWVIRNLCRCSCSSLSPPPAALPRSFVLENPPGSSFKKQECSPKK